MDKKKKILIAIGGVFLVLFLAYLMLSVWFVKEYKNFPTQDEMKKIERNNALIKKSVDDALQREKRRGLQF